MKTSAVVLLVTHFLGAGHTETSVVTVDHYEDSVMNVAHCQIAAEDMAKNLKEAHIEAVVGCSLHPEGLRTDLTSINSNMWIHYNTEEKE